MSPALCITGADFADHTTVAHSHDRRTVLPRRGYHCRPSPSGMSVRFCPSSADLPHSADLHSDGSELLLKRCELLLDLRLLRLEPGYTPAAAAILHAATLHGGHAHS